MLRKKPRDVEPRQPGAFALAAFGLVLSVLAHRTGRLGPSIWAHVGFNATTVVALVAGG